MAEFSAVLRSDTEFPFWDGSGGIQDQAWTAVWLGGVYLPGICTVNCERKRSIEKKKTKGTDGTTVTDQGDELVEIKIRVEVYNRDQWREWQAVIGQIWPKKAGGDRQPLEIMHPLPNFLGIKDVYIERLKPNPPENQVMIIEIDCTEYAPNPKPVEKAAGRNDPPVKDTMMVPGTQIENMILKGVANEAATNVVDQINAMNDQVLADVANTPGNFS